MLSHAAQGTTFLSGQMSGIFYFGVQGELTGFETLGFETWDDETSTSGTTEATGVHFQHSKQVEL